jgi:hypothetical protein
MKRRVLALLFATLLLSTLVVPVFAYDVPSDTIVYVTPTGECYHRYKCSYTDTTTTKAMTIKSAVSKGYTACSRCRPGVLTGEYNWADDNHKTGSSKKGSKSKIGYIIETTISVALLCVSVGPFVVFSIAAIKEKIKGRR